MNVREHDIIQVILSALRSDPALLSSHESRWSSARKMTSKRHHVRQHEQWMNLWAAHFCRRNCINYICTSWLLLFSSWHQWLHCRGLWLLDSFEFHCQCREFHKLKLPRLYRHIYPVEGIYENLFDVTQKFHALLLEPIATTSAIAVIFVVDWRALSAPPCPPPFRRAWRYRVRHGESLPRLSFRSGLRYCMLPFHYHDVLRPISFSYVSLSYECKVAW